MRILPLGGAHEVGASSTIIEFASHRVLVDAGIRIGEEGGDQLPDLSIIQEEAGDIDAIFLTHAHMDHSGALPLVHLAFPNTPIYMTPASYAVVRILFEDSLRLMEGKYEKEGEIPLYPSAAVESCLGVIRPVPFEYPLNIANRSLSATFHPAGHILGASAIHISGDSGSVLLSGDISVSDQRTIPGMHAPPVEPDVVIVESTYGDRIHAHRPTQEARLVRTVGEVIESGGKVIIPAFAVGRAQEVILILQHAMKEKELPPFPLYVDGMVRSVCDAYSRFPTYLQRHLRRSVKDGVHPFFPAGGTVQRVRSHAQRKELLEGPPCCIIASSGMMTGGPSAFYAEALASDARNLIAITGYQDEEAPGRRLLELAEAPPASRRLRLNQRDTEIHCQVEKYSLSAHADSGEISGLVGRMDPSQGVVLVHGDREARESLADTIDGLVHCQVHMPHNGETLEFHGGRRVFYRSFDRAHKPRNPQIGPPGQILDRKALSHLHQALWAETGPRGLFRIPDLYARWYGPNHQMSDQEVEDLHALMQDQPFFLPDRKRPHLFRVRSPQDIFGPREERPEPSSGGAMEMNQALQRVGELFSPESGLYKKGSRQDEHTLLLFFHFPHVARQTHAATIQQLEEETGWRVELNKMPHHAVLEEQARRLLKDDFTFVRNPSILHEQQSVRLRVCPTSSQSPSQATLEALCQEYLKSTGYQLEIKITSPETLPTQKKSPPPKQTKQTTAEPLEINLAYQKIDLAFANLPDRPYKKSKKGEKVVLSFLSPSIGERYRPQIDALCEEIGWPIAINPEPNQYGIKQEVRAMLPASWGLRKEPGILRKHGIVRICLQHPPAREALEAFAQEVFQRTGFHLEVSETT